MTKRKSYHEIVKTSMLVSCLEYNNNGAIYFQEKWVDEHNAYLAMFPPGYILPMTIEVHSLD